MDKVVNKTVGALTRLGESLERKLSIDDNYGSYSTHPRHNSMFPSSGSAFRPLDKKKSKHNIYASQGRNLAYGGARKHSSDNIAASPGYMNYNRYKEPNTTSQYGEFSNVSPYGTDFRGSAQYDPNYGYNPRGMYPGNAGYAPDYYIAERRQIELVPAPPPRIIREPVHVPVPVDRPVPQPYPVGVPVPVAVDRPVPVPVPSPVFFDRLVPYPVAVPSPPVCVPVPVPVPSPVPCYVPVGVPVPSPVASPVMFEQSVTHSQRWMTGSPVMMQQPRYLAGSPAMGMNPMMFYGGGSFTR